VFLTYSPVSSAQFCAPGVPLTAIDEIFDELGPIPRLCFGTEDFLKSHRKKMETALDDLTLGNIEKMLFASKNLALDASSHTIFMLRRLGVAINSNDWDTVAINPFVESKISTQLRALQRHE
jgi:hypothetical protein